MNKISRPILLVEDNPMDIDLTQRAFSERNLSNPLIVARDGQEALDYFDGLGDGDPLPVVILLDLQLPKVSGLDVLRAIKDNPLVCKLPVVVLTSSTEDRDIDTAYALCANSYIVKPVDFDKFMDVATQIEIYWLALNSPPR
jgi:CheY-like chemotaxis protein